MVGYPLPIRAAVVAIALVSWNLTTTHCAFSAVTTATNESSSAGDEQDICPMHAPQEPTAPQPAKKGGCDDLPCCKNLPASKPAPATCVFKPIISLSDVDYLSANLSFLTPERAQPPLPLETGPPVAINFAELVLQRSIPAHAPPVRVI